MTIYKVIPMPDGPDGLWAVQCIGTDGNATVIGPFDSETEAHEEAERMADLEGERSA